MEGGKGHPHPTVRPPARRIADDDDAIVMQMDTFSIPVPSPPFVPPNPPGVIQSDEKSPPSLPSLLWPLAN